MHPIDRVFAHVRASYPHGIFAYDLDKLLTAAYRAVYGTDYTAGSMGILTEKLYAAGIRVHCSTD